MGKFIFKILLLSHATTGGALPWSPMEHLGLLYQAQWIADTQLPYFETFCAPVNCPERVVKQFPHQKACIFAYGSLLNRESAARTLSPEALKTLEPALAFGYQRVFDRHVPSAHHWGEKERINDTAMLNLRKHHDFGRVVNGALLSVDCEELAALIKREVGYDLIPVVVSSWDRTSFSIAYAFVAPRTNRAGKSYTLPCINPIPAYAEAAKEGASQFGKEFLHVWEQTTFLADGVTPYSTWENAPHLDQASLCIFFPY